MGRTETERFRDEDVELAALAKALGHPARIAILRHLARTRGCICGELVDVLPLAQSTVSQHLRALKEVGLIDGDVEGASICYCINRTAWNTATRRLGALFSSLTEQCC